MGRPSRPISPPQPPPPAHARAVETPPKSPNGSSIDPGGHRSGGAGGVECSSIATPTRARSRFVKSNLEVSPP